MKTNYVKGDVIRFELDNNPAHKGVGTFVDYCQSGNLAVNLLEDCKELHAGTAIFVFPDEIR